MTHAGLLVASVMLTDLMPLGELGPLANLGVAGVILFIWWVERKERRERQTEDDKRYGELLKQLTDSLNTRIVQCPLSVSTATIERMLTEIHMIVKAVSERTK